MPVVFVNYRVREEPGYASLLHRELQRHFGADNVFLASQSIRAGDDFVREVFDRLHECAVLLAVIGPRWAMVTGDGSIDWVHQEIHAALVSGIRVVPVLIEDAELPEESALPAEIADLARCQALRLRHYSLDSDVFALVEELRRTVPVLRSRTADVNAVAEGSPIHYAIRGTSEGHWRIGAIPGTIRRVKHVDVWVNSENTDMRMARHNEFSVSAIIRYWGAERDMSGRVVADIVADELSSVVSDHRPVAPGTAIVTGSGMLAATNNVRRIIHVASVQGEPGAGFRQVRNIDQCVTNALVQAELEAKRDPAVRTVLFPLFGTGTSVKADVEATGRGMATAALDYMTAHPATLLREVNFLGYTVEEFALLRRVLDALPLTPIDRPIPR